MSQPPISVSYSLEDILKRIEDKIDNNHKDVNQRLDKIDDRFIKIDERLNNLEKGQAKLEAKLEAIDTDVKELRGSSRAQIWTLIGILTTAVAGFLVAVGRFVIAGNP